MLPRFSRFSRPFHRVSALLLALVLFLGCLSVPERAAADVKTAADGFELQADIDLIGGSATITVTKDFTLDSPIYIYEDQDILIEGAGDGVSIFADGKYGTGFTVSPGSRLTLRNVRLVGTENASAPLIALQTGSTCVLGENAVLEGNILSPDAFDPLGGGVCVNEATLILEGGTIRGCGAEKGGAAALLGGASLRLEDGELSGNRASRGGAVYVEPYGAAASVELLGGTIQDNAADESAVLCLETSPSYPSPNLTLGGNLTIEGNAAGEQAEGLQLDGWSLPIPLASALTGRVELAISEKTPKDSAVFAGTAGHKLNAADAAAFSLPGGRAFSLKDGGLTVSEKPPLYLSGVTLEGEALVGSTLTAKLTVREGMEGTEKPALFYAWERGAGGEYKTIAGAEGPSYAVGSEDIDHSLRVRVWQEGREDEAVCSAAVGPVELPPTPPMSGSVQIQGEPLATNILRAKGEDLPENAVFHWQIAESLGGKPFGEFRDIPGAEGENLTVLALWTGKFLRLRVTAEGREGEVVSDPVGPVRLLSLEGSVQIERVQAKDAASYRTGETLRVRLPAGLHKDWLGFQWEAGDRPDGSFTPIPNAYAESFTPGAALIGKYLRLVVVGRENYGNNLLSPVIGPLLPGKESVRFEIAGEALLGETLHARAVLVGEAAKQDEIQVYWQRAALADGVYATLPGSGSGEYTLQERDEGLFFRAWAPELEMYSEPIGPVKGRALAVTVYLEGTPQVGLPLTAVVEGAPEKDSYLAVWEKRPKNGLRFQQIAGATGLDYIPNEGDVGSCLRVRVVGLGIWRGEAVSPASEPVAPAPPKKPVLKSVKAIEDLMLTAPLKSAEETLQELYKQRSSVQAFLSDREEAVELPVLWTLEGSFSAEAGAVNRFRWELADTEGFTLPIEPYAAKSGGTSQTGGVICVTNGPLPAKTYAVTLEEDIQHGSLLPSLTQAEEGLWVKVTPQADIGWRVKEVYAYDPADRENTYVTLSEGETGYGFDMPAHDVVIGAVFEEIPLQPVAGILLWSEEEEEEEPIREHVVLCEKLNLRSGPGTGYEKSGSLKKGQRLLLIEESETETGSGAERWGFVLLPDGRTGYVSMEYIAPLSDCLCVTARTLNVRSGPGTEDRRLGTLKRGEWVYASAPEDGWVRIDWKGRPAWVSAMYLDSAQENLLPYLPYLEITE